MPVRLLLALLLAIPSAAQPLLDEAYAALRTGDLDLAVARFQAGLAANPDHIAARKDFAYTLLKAGETHLARDQFHRVLDLTPEDLNLAMECAYLDYETGHIAEARRGFARLRDAGYPGAAEAFARIDAPIAEGIARWTRVLKEGPENFSGHEELARLAGQRDDAELAVRHLEAARRLRPERRELLLALGRVLDRLGRREESHAALLAASRSPEPRTAEAARELLGGRYPFVYEFQRAISLDPGNPELRRELAYLYLQMGDSGQAEREFAAVLAIRPEDRLSMAQLGFLRLARKETGTGMPLLERVLASGDDELSDRVREALRRPRTLRRREEIPRAGVSQEAKQLAELSYEKGYMKDALRYLTIAHENAPLDFDVLLRLGWTNNILHDDRAAARWFSLAQRSPDPRQAEEAARAYRNLAGEQQALRTTFWMLPQFSSRWRDLFAYSQVKTELPFHRLRLRPYVSARLLADARGLERARTAFAPQALSENAGILALGVATPLRSGISGWAEAGTAFGFRSGTAVSRVVPDYRGGLVWTRGWGTPLGADRRGWFADTANDAVYVSRFAHDVLFVNQNRAGWTLAPSWQVFGTWNTNADLRREAWANFVEFGGGVRTRWQGLPPNVHFTVQWLRGVYTRNQGNPRGPNYFDLRAGFWYAITR